MKRTTQILAVLGLALAVVIISTGVALAYPTGWTSDNPVVSSGASTVDVASHASSVWIAYRDASGIKVKKSTDKGVSFSSPISVEADPNSDTPQITVTSTGDLYCSYWFSDGTNDAVKIKKSTNGGSSFVDFASYTNTYGDKRIWSHAMTHGGDAPAICWDQSNPDTASHRRDVFYVVLGAGGVLARNNAAHTDDANENRYPTVATDGAGKYFIAFVCIDCVGTEDSGIWVTRVNGSTTYDQIYNGQYAYAGYPSVAYHGVAGQFDVAYTRDNSGNKVAYTNSWNGSSWGTGITLYNAGSTDPYSKALPFDGGDAICRASNGSDAMRATVATDTVLMKGVNPTNNPRSIAASTETGSSEVYAAVVTTSGAVLVKRTDLVDPAASGVQVSGGNTVGGVIYVRQNFAVSYQGVTDDWNLTGTDANDDSFTNGVSSVYMGWANSPTPSTWAELPTTQGANPLENAPWNSTMDVSGISDGNIYIHGLLTDTAGRTGEVVSSQVILDRTKPTVDNATLNPSGSGWHKSPVQITVTGHDANLLTCQYSLDSGGHWTDVASGGTFSVSDFDGAVYYRALDKAGNASESKLVTVQSDTTGPTISITKPATDTVTANADGTVPLSATSSDSGSGVTWMSMSINGKQVSTSDGNDAYGWDTSGLSDGTYTLTVQARDAAGNVSTATKRFNLISKTTAYSDSYFAEGCTRDGFDEWLCVLNPQKAVANLDLSFQLETGEVKTKRVSIPATTRSTINVADIVGRGHDVSTKIHADQVVICERPMYFNQHGWTGGHIAPARNTLQNTFYFAEGTTRPNFEEWLTLQNPGNQQANVTATYMLGTGQNITRQYAVPPTTRKTVSVNNEVGPGQDVSVKLTSDKPIAAERPMYFNNHGWTGGHDVIGTTSPNTTWYFAEGTTRANFEEWLCIQNPNDGTANVTVNYSTGQKKTYNVQAHSRYTVNVNADVGPNQDVSATVTSDKPVIAERPMYFDYNGETGGSDVLGANPMTQTGTNYYLAEGTTRTGFSEYVTIYNPGPTSGKIYLTYVFSDGTTQPWQATHAAPYDVVANGQRMTINVASDVGANKDVSILIHSEYPVVVERPMYFNYKGWTGGHCGVPFVSQ